MTRNAIKVIIFDWGRTLHDPETESLFPGVPELIRALAERYTLALVSLAKRLSPEDRRRAIEQSGITGYFTHILVGGEDKDMLYNELIGKLNVPLDQILVVDDRTIRGIAWANRRGIATVWIKNGKFAQELPTPETGDPTWTISTVVELKNILKYR